MHSMPAVDVQKMLLQPVDDFDIVSGDSEKPFKITAFDDRARLCSKCGAVFGGNLIKHLLNTM